MTNSVTKPVETLHPDAASKARKLGAAGTGSKWLSTPAIVFASLFVALPVMIVIVYSFMTQPSSGLGVSGPGTLDAWKRLVFDTDFDGTVRFSLQYLTVVGRSVLIAGSAAIICLVIGVPAAYWISTQPPSRRNLVLLAVTIPFWINTLIRTYAWMIIFSQNGVISAAGQAIGIFGEPVSLYPSTFATLVGLVYVYIPFVVLPVYTSAAKFDFRLAEAAYDLGARRAAVIRRILFPALAPGMLAGFVLVFVPALGAFIQPALLGGSKVELIGTLIQRQFKESMNWPFGSALSVALLLMTVVTLVLFLVIARRVSRDQEKASLI